MLFVAAWVILVVALYLLAQRAVVPPAAEGPCRVGPFEPPARTALILLNALGNAVVLAWVGLPGPVVAGVAGVNVAAAIPPLAASPPFARVLGWTSLAMPMSWPATGAGLGVLAINALAALAGKTRCGLGVDATTGTLIVRGGVVYAFPCGFNLGNVMFIHRHFVDGDGACRPDLVAHEAGHTLNVAAFGSLFHFVGAIHQNWWPPRGGAGPQAYAELLAESRSRAAGRAWVNAWPSAMMAAETELREP